MAIGPVGLRKIVGWFWRLLGWENRRGRKLVAGGVMVGYVLAGDVDGRYEPATTSSSH
jgi:hypothetical protein